KAAGNTGRPGTPTYNTLSGTCSNIYCHDSARFKNAYGGGNGLAPVWNNTAYVTGGAAPTVNDCNKCHGYPPSGAHTVGTNCKQCHDNIAAGSANRTFTSLAQHVNGNLEFLSTCYSCHGASNNGDLGAAPNRGHVIHYNSAVNATGSITNDFSTGYAFSCNSCHPANTASGHNQGANVPGIRYAEIGGTKLTGYTNGSTNAFDSYGLYYGTNGTCTNTVCHTRDGVSATPLKAPVWNLGKTGDCAFCHKASGDSYAVMTGADANKLSQAHGQHMASDRYGQAAMFTCNICHAGTAQNNTTIINSAAARNQHPNAAKNVEFNATAGGNWSGTQCSNTYCHSNGTAAVGSHGAMNWTGTMNAECSSCHGGDAGAVNRITTVAHGAHTNAATNAVGRNIACGECHSATVAAANTRTVTSYVYHTNKETNIRFDNGSLVRDADNPYYGGKVATS
ncbi:MAG: CxxxxCH/CxxCH domain-containing protein, partial [Geobacter sp.]|nr:CxxxxCH/CxxCH domain-containing protein [Geobacter sp.]